MKYLIRHKRLVAIFVVAAVGFAGVVTASQRSSARWSALPSSARNMVSALSVAAAEIVGNSFGIGVAGDGALPGGEMIVLDDGKGIDGGGDGGSYPSSSYPTSSSPEYLLQKDGYPMMEEDGNIPLIPVSAITSAPQTLSSMTDMPLTVLEVPSSSTSSLSSSEKISCSFPSVPPAPSSLSGRIIFNEIAWMGSPSSSLSAGASEGNAEWMELKNNSSGTVALDGWEIENVSGKIAIRFGEDDRVGAGGLLLLMRGSTTFPYAHASERSYSGNLKNDGDDLVLFDPSCGISDYVAFADGWPAGDNAAKKTMERTAIGGWHTSNTPGGTPGAENSPPVEPIRYEVTVFFSGEGGAMVASDPSGMACGSARCTASFEEGTKVKLTAAPATGTVFDGWSGACSGGGACAFTVNGKTDITAIFRVPDVSSHIEESPPIPSSSGASSSSPPVPAGSVLIMAVQIAGAASSNDYVKLYNPTATPIGMDGWKLKKRSATGAEYSLRTFPSGTEIGAGGYLMWANSKDGFAASLGADVSSTETLAADNSIAVIDAGGNVDDAFAWGTGSGQFGEGDPFPTDPAEGQMFVRRTAGNVPVDTGSNKEDFVLE